MPQARPGMYRAGSDIVGLAPADCLFVDDDPELVFAAIGLGYRGVAICRDSVRPDDVPWIESLDDLLGIVAVD